MHILIIEDEKKTSSFLRKGLTKSGYIVDTEENGDEGLLFVYLIAIYRLVDLMLLKWALACASALWCLPAAILLILWMKFQPSVA